MSKDYNSLEYKKEHHKHKWANDPRWRAITLANNRVWQVLRGKVKHSKTLQCSTEDLIEYLEKQFTEEMNWSNYGHVWTINHKIPLREAYDQGKEAFEEAQIYTNLEPIKKELNVKEKKGKTFRKRTSRTNSTMVSET